MRKKKPALGLYLHIPFCRSKCAYCDFYSLAGQEAWMDDCQRALLRHLEEAAPQAAAYTVDTVYFGGGTPSFYGEKRLRELLRAVKRLYPVARGAEITVEANPDSVSLPMLRRLRRAGFNRLSLGVQSACDEELAALGRPHTFAQAEQAAAWARQAKWKNLSLDLIYGLPGQDPAGWQETVERVLKLEPEHLSAYGLKVEEGTPLARRVAEGEALPDDEAQAGCYLWTVERLAQAGYEQYEISNFAKPGFSSRHNGKYWLTQPYLGFGPGAHSDFGGRRYSFVRSLERYVHGVLDGGAVLDENEPVSGRERAREYLMLRLRTVRGVEGEEYRRQFLQSFDPLEARLLELEAHGLARRSAGRWHLTPEGFLVSNQIISELLELQEQSALRSAPPRLRPDRPAP